MSPHLPRARQVAHGSDLIRGNKARRLLSLEASS
jgi:hypothetical protein